MAHIILELSYGHNLSKKMMVLLVNSDANHITMEQTIESKITG